MNYVFTFLCACFVFLSHIDSGFCQKKITLTKNQILRIGNGIEPKDLDPAIATGAPESNILDALFEGLTSTSPFENDPVPGVAESWTLSFDGLKYQFVIRKKAKWSDGKSITAQDFVDSWIRVLDPKTASEYAYQLYSIKNGEAFNTGKLKDAKQLGVKALNEHLLEVELEHPTPYFLHLTAFHTLYPTPKHVIDKIPGTAWTKEKNIVSNGPFKLAEARLHQHIKLVRNEEYWDKDKVLLNEIYIYPIENKYTEEKTFLSGKLDITYTIPAMRLPYYENLKKTQSTTYNPLHIDPLYGVYYFRFNTTRKPLNDPRVRRALSLAIDRKQIVEHIVKGEKIPAGSFTPGSPLYSYPETLHTSLTERDLKEARQLLMQAGYADGKNMPKFDILYDTDEDNKRIAVAIQSMWQKNLGIQVGLFNQEWKVYLESLHQLNYDIGKSRWIGDYPDPNTFLDLHVTKGGNNDTGWSNKIYDESIHKASLSLNAEERFKFFKKAESILLQELPIMPIFFYTSARLVSNSVRMYKFETKEFKEWRSDIMDRSHFKYLVKVEE